MKTQLLALLKKYSYKTGDFTLSSGQKSTFYLDLKPTILQSNGHYYAGQLILEELSKLPKTHAVAGVDLGGFPLASAVSTLSRVVEFDGIDQYGNVCTHKNALYPMNALYIRKTQKLHGTKKMVEGFYEQGDGVVLLEDVITTGQSSVNSIETLLANGLSPVGVICVVDRLEGGAEHISKTFRIPVVGLYSIKDFQ